MTRNGIFKVGSSFDVGPDQMGFLLRRDDFMASPSDALLGLDSAHSLWYMVDISLSCSSVRRYFVGLPSNLVLILPEGD